MNTPARTTRRRELRRRVLLAVWLLAAVGIVARAGQLQLLEASDWREQAVAQQRKPNDVDAPRGTIFDRDGVALAISLERYRIEVDADQLEDRALVRARLREALGISDRRALELTDPERDWVVVPGRYEPAVRTLLADLRHVHLTREFDRDYPHEALASGVLGRTVDDRGAGGIEQAFDDLLRGTPGRSVVARDNHGNEIPGQVFEVSPPRPGGDVHLTIDLDLQEIAHQALKEAIESNEARGGDLIIVDPRTGEILAMVSIEGGRSNGLSVINTPYEPGSTLKPFTVAGLLQSGKARLSDPVDIEGGRWEINGRPLTDSHPDSTVRTIADALRVSSNVGIAKAALPLTPGEQYQTLRDFGFGVPTGIPLPAEASGRLRKPEEWSGPSPQSLAIGYEINVTPLQMAMAYGALANGGRLLEARLVRETRTPDGRVTVHAPTVLRQVVAGGVTGQLARVLVDVVEDGTGTQAQLETFSVAGKTGTSRVYSFQEGGYERGRYFASFAGFFPAEAPQLVIFVKLDSPSGSSYYGGSTAGPVTRATMEAALAARQSPLDRRALLASARTPASTSTPLTPIRFAAHQAETVEPRPWTGAGLDPRLPGGDEYAGPSEVTVPDLSDLPTRVAARRLHALGFRVAIEVRGSGPVTLPEPGTRWPVGDTVRLRTGRGAR